MQPIIAKCDVLPHLVVREFGQMAHLDLSHAVMKPAPLVRYEIAQDVGRAKQLLVLSVIAASIIVVFAALFLSTLG